MADILYGLYGERPPLFDDIIGRRADLEPAVFPDYELCVQLAADMPARVQAILAESRSPEEMGDFMAYVARPRPRARLGGWVAEVSEEELAIIDNYDIEGLWMTRHDNRPVKVGPHAELREASLHVATRETGKIYPVRRFFGEGLIPANLNDIKRSREIARIARELFLGEHS